MISFDDGDHSLAKRRIKQFLLSGGLRHLVRFPQPPDTPVTLLTDSSLLVTGRFAKSYAELLRVMFV